MESAIALNRSNYTKKREWSPAHSTTTLTFHHTIKWAVCRSDDFFVSNWLKRNYSSFTAVYL